MIGSLSRLRGRVRVGASQNLAILDENRSAKSSRDFGFPQKMKRELNARPFP